MEGANQEGKQFLHPFNFPFMYQDFRPWFPEFQNKNALKNRYGFQVRILQ